MPYAWSREEENAYRRQRYAKDPAASAKRNKKYLAWKKQQMPDIHRCGLSFTPMDLNKRRGWTYLRNKDFVVRFVTRKRLDHVKDGIPTTLATRK